MAQQRAEVGDIVRVNHLGRIWFAIVKDVEQEAKGKGIHYNTEPIVRSISWFHIPSSSVTQVYRKLGRARGGGA